MIEHSGGVHNHLYYNHDSKASKLQQLSTSLMIERQQEVNESKLKARNHQSDQLYQKKLQTALAELFISLLTEEGRQAERPKLSRQSIDLKKVPPMCVKVLQPLLKEISEFNEALDCEEFVASCLLLIKTLSVGEKQHLLQFKASHQSPKQSRSPFSHHPEINPVSKAILVEDELYKVPVEHRLLARGKHRDHKLARM